MSFYNQSFEFYKKNIGLVCGNATAWSFAAFFVIHHLCDVCGWLILAARLAAWLIVCAAFYERHVTH
jgi:hypothetical protein